MKGEVKSILRHNYGFIRGENQIEYFFHREDYVGNFGELERDYDTGEGILVEFSVVGSQRGPRAADVVRI